MERLSDIQQLNRSIMFGTWTDVELRSMTDAIRFAQTNLRKQIKRSLDVGVQVRWSSPTHLGCSRYSYKDCHQVCHSP